MAGPVLSDAKRRLVEKLLRGEGAAPAAAFPRSRPAGPVPATAGQRAIWMHEQIAGRPVYNESATIRRLGPLDADAVERALTEIVRRHESWRTRYSASEGRLTQHVEPPFPAPLAREDLRSLDPARREERAAAAAAADAAAPFDLSRLPLFRARLVRFGENEHRLYLTLHHLIFDTASLFGV
ncbi:MAG TPA: condensation domain-containing protein, partial [Thermoanaerobaculia bacterium]|nr:condensation domain-containing protein [Thermoanaerobaculia bacterium]